MKTLLIILDMVLYCSANGNKDTMPGNLIAILSLFHMSLKLDKVYSLPFIITPPPFLIAFQMTFSECHLHSCYS